MSDGDCMTLLIALAGILVALFMNTVSDAWFFLAGFNGGIGVIYLLRWYWWRINAWSELVCLLSLLGLSLMMYALKDATVAQSSVVLWEGTALAIPVASLFDFPYSLLVTVPLSVLLALIATWMTPPTDLSVLKAFHRRVQAGGPGWRTIHRLVLQESPGFVAHSPECEEPSAVDPFLLGGLPMAHRVGKLIIGDAFVAEPSFPSFWLGILLLVIGSACLIAVACWFPRKAPGDNPSTS